MPTSSDDDARSLSVAVDRKGMCDLSSWTQARSNNWPLASASWVALQSSDRMQGDKIHITHLLSVLSGVVACKMLVYQILYSLSHRIDNIFGFQAKTKDKTTGLAKSLVFGWTDGTKTLANQQPYVCAAYALYARARIGLPIDVGCAHDKGLAHGLPMHVNIVSIPENFAALAPPMVLFPLACPMHPFLAPPPTIFR